MDAVPRTRIQDFSQESYQPKHQNEKAKEVALKILAVSGLSVGALIGIVSIVLSPPIWVVASSLVLIGLGVWASCYAFTGEAIKHPDGAFSLEKVVSHTTPLEPSTQQALAKAWNEAPADFPQNEVKQFLRHISYQFEEWKPFLEALTSENREEVFLWLSEDKPCSDLSSLVDFTEQLPLAWLETAFITPRASVLLFSKLGDRIQELTPRAFVQLFKEREFVSAREQAYVRTLEPEVLTRYGQWQGVHLRSPFPVFNHLTEPQKRAIQWLQVLRSQRRLSESFFHEAAHFNQEALEYLFTTELSLSKKQILRNVLGQEQVAALGDDHLLTLIDPAMLLQSTPFLAKLSIAQTNALVTRHRVNFTSLQGLRGDQLAAIPWDQVQFDDRGPFNRFEGGDLSYLNQVPLPLFRQLVAAVVVPAGAWEVADSLNEERRQILEEAL